MGVPWGALPRLEQGNGGDGDRVSTAWAARAQCLCLGESDTRLGPPVSPWVTHLRPCMVSASLWICKVVWVFAGWGSGDAGTSFFWSVLPPRGLSRSCFLSWKGQKAAASSHLLPTIHHYRPSRVSPQAALSMMKQPFDLSFHHLKFLDPAHPCCASRMFSKPGAAESCGSGICMGPQQYPLSWPFPEMIHYSSAIPLLDAGAGSEPSAAHAKPGLLCVHFAFIK